MWNLEIREFHPTQAQAEFRRDNLKALHPNWKVSVRMTGKLWFKNGQRVDTRSFLVTAHSKELDIFEKIAKKRAQ